MIVITQPTYLPWSGYFDLIDRSDTFVFLDDVQFNTRSWQQKNRIIFNQEYKDLTVPIKKKGLRFQKIKETEVFDHKFIDQHLSIIYNSYHKTKFFDVYFPILKEAYEEFNNTNLIAEINILLIKRICSLIKINSKFIFSSSLNINFKGSEKLASICSTLNDKNYLTNIGALDYLQKDEEKKYFYLKKIKVFIQNYKCVKYHQKSSDFLDKASILDLLFNEGDKTLDVIKSGRGKDQICV